MNRIDFMNQLERLLQSISSTEREEAIQYYNDYFDDAGEENEQEVIEALGNPARVAENIKKDLAGNGYGEGFAQKVKASDRVLMEYGKDIPEDSEESQESEENKVSGQTAGGTAGSPGQSGGGPAAEGDAGSRQSAEFSADYNRERQNASAGYNRERQDSSAGYNREGRDFSAGYSWERQDSSTAYDRKSQDYDRAYGSRQSNPFEDYASGSQYTAGNGSAGAWNQETSGYAPDKHKKGEGMPVWAIAMLITVLVIASPVLGAVALGALGIVLGGLGGWFGMIFGFGVASIVLLVVMLVLVVVGIICFFVSPWVGIALIGGGLICGSIGLLFLMLTVAMAGIVTPAICRGIAFVFRGFKRKRAFAN